MISCMIKRNLTSKNTIRQFPALLSLSLMAFFLLVAKELDSTQSYYHYRSLQGKTNWFKGFFGQTKLRCLLHNQSQTLTIELHLLK